MLWRCSDARRTGHRGAGCAHPALRQHRRRQVHTRQRHPAYIRQQCMEFRVYTRGIGLMAVLPNIQAVSDFADLSGSRWTQKIEACERGRGSGPTGPLVRAAIPGAPGLPAVGPAASGVRGALAPPGLFGAPLQRLRFFTPRLAPVAPSSTAFRPLTPRRIIGPLDHSNPTSRIDWRTSCIVAPLHAC